MRCPYSDPLTRKSAISVSNPTNSEASPPLPMATAALLRSLRRSELLSASLSAYRSVSANGKTPLAGKLGFFVRPFSVGNDVDLGTTNSKSMEGKIPNPNVIENDQGTLSVVAINHKGELFVGTPLTNPASTDTVFRFEDSQTQTEMKMVPCKIVEAPDGNALVEADRQRYSPSQIEAFFLAKMKQFTEAHHKKTGTYKALRTLNPGFLDMYASLSTWNIKEKLREHRDKIPAEIVREIETAVSELSRARREADEDMMDMDKIRGVRDKVNAANKAASKISGFKSSRSTPI